MASSAQKTPIIKPSKIKNEAKYSAMRSGEISHPAIITITVIIVVSNISGTEIPSTPSE